MSIGERVRKEREARGLTQASMAALVQASERTVNDWERDISSPKASVLAALAVHGFDVRYVITGSRDYTPPAPLEPEEQVLLAHWRAAPRAVRNAAMGALLGASPARRSHVEQVFNGEVGHVFKGDATFHNQRIVMGKNKPKRKPDE